MNYYFDTEFWESGAANPIQLISIGIVADDGREFYAESSDVDLWVAGQRNSWLVNNVIKHLKGPRMPHHEIGTAILKFIGMDQKPKFWAYFADYDWVVFCQLFGSMVTLPQTFPHYCRDLKQEMARLGIGKPLIEGCGPPHHALSDARWGKAFFDYMKTKGLVEF